MARPLRSDIEGGWYHVVCRGLEKRAIFREDREHEHFLDLLAAATERYNLRVHSFVLMTNHYHLLLETPEANLSRAMQWLNVSYSVWFNKRNDRVGPLFQGRFKSIPVQPGNWSYELSLYIHLNPVMRAVFDLGKLDRLIESRGYRKPSAEQVRKRLAQLRTYRWSSYRYYGGYAKRPEWLDTSALLAKAAYRKKERMSNYRRDVKERLTHGVSEPFAERMKERLAIGSHKFVQDIKAAAKPGRETSGRSFLSKRVSFDEIQSIVESMRGLRADEFMAIRADWARPLLMWGARSFCGMTLREIGERAGGRDYTAVFMMIKAFEKRAREDESLQNRMQELKKRVI